MSAASAGEVPELPVRTPSGATAVVGQSPTSRAAMDTVPAGTGEAERGAAGAGAEPDDRGRLTRDRWGYRTPTIQAPGVRVRRLEALAGRRAAANDEPPVDATATRCGEYGDRRHSAQRQPERPKPVSPWRGWGRLRADPARILLARGETASPCVTVEEAPGPHPMRRAAEGRGRQRRSAAGCRPGPAGRAVAERRAKGALAVAPALPASEKAQRSVRLRRPAPTLRRGRTGTPTATPVRRGPTVEPRPRRSQDPCSSAAVHRLRLPQRGYRQPRHAA